MPAFVRAHAYGVGTDLVWYVRLVVAAFLYSVAMPPVSGGTVACYAMILVMMGIPAQAIGVLTALDLLLDGAMTACAVGSNMLEVFATADDLGMVRKP